MKTTIIDLRRLAFTGASRAAQTNRRSFANAKPLPTMDFLLQQVVARAVNKEDENDNMLRQNYNTPAPGVGISNAAAN